jgi:protease-4
MPVERVDEVARGRVWLGERAHELGLVDRLGGLSEAIDSAAALAGVSGDFRVAYLEREPGFREALAMQLARALGGSLERVARLQRSPLLDAADGLQREFARLLRWNDPQALYYHCFCDVR